MWLSKVHVYPKMSSFSLHLATAISLDRFPGSNLTFDFSMLVPFVQVTLEMNTHMCVGGEYGSSCPKRNVQPWRASQSLSRTPGAPREYELVAAHAEVLSVFLHFFGTLLGRLCWAVPESGTQTRRIRRTLGTNEFMCRQCHCTIFHPHFRQRPSDASDLLNIKFPAVVALPL